MEGFTAHQATRLTGCTPRQLRYWDQIGLVRPSVQSTGGRPGVPRLYLFSCGDDRLCQRVARQIVRQRRGRRRQARQRHPLAGAKSLKDLVDAEWAVTLATGVRAFECEDIFTAHGLPVPKARVQCESMLALLALLSSSDLLAFLPPQWLESPLTRNVLREIRVKEVIDGQGIHN